MECLVEVAAAIEGFISHFFNLNGSYLNNVFDKKKLKNAFFCLDKEIMFVHY